VVNYSASLSASYELDFWGKNREALQAAEETAVATRFDREVVALTTLTSVANAYFQVLASQDRIRTAERNIVSATRVLEAIRQRFKAGTGTDLDVAQQEAIVANQKASVPPLRRGSSASPSRASRARRCFWFIGQPRAGIRKGYTIAYPQHIFVASRRGASPTGRR